MTEPMKEEGRPAVCRCYEHPRDRVCKVHPRPEEHTFDKYLGVNREGGNVRVRVGEWGREAQITMSLDAWGSINAKLGVGASGVCANCGEENP